MILLRRPFPIFDVDLIGIVMIGIVAIIAYLTIYVPARAVGQVDQQLAVAVQTTQAAITRSSDRLDRARAEQHDLSRKVESRERNLPKAGETSDFPRHIATAAEENGVTVQQLAPNPPRNTEQGMVFDIQVVARGGLAQFIGMLDDLRRKCPHMQVRDFSIAHGPDAAEPASTLSLTLRIYLSPATAEGKS